MRAPTLPRILLPRLAGLVLLLALAGCASLGPKQTIKVDAISSTSTFARGISYVLVPARQELIQEPGTHARAMAAVNAALQDKGQFPAPVGTEPQYVVEVDYGAGYSIPQANSGPVQEKFLTLSARNYVRNGQGEELWNVKTTVAVAGDEINESLPILAAVALDYAGSDTGTERMLQIHVNAPAVQRIRNSAIFAGAGINNY